MVGVKPFDIRIVSADGLPNVNIFSKMSVYAVVTLSFRGRLFDSKTIPADGRGGSSPRWDIPLRFVVNKHGAEYGGHDLYIQLMSRRRFLRDKAIGLVHFPLEELQEFADDNDGDAMLITAPVTHNSSGVTIGKLKFSFRFGLYYDVPENN